MSDYKKTGLRGWKRGMRILELIEKIQINFTLNIDKKIYFKIIFYAMGGL